MNEIKNNDSVNSKNEKEEKKKKFVKKHLKEYVKEYCEISSIQGLSYIIKDITLFERCWWILVFLTCVGGCTHMILQLANKWIDTPVLVSIATKNTPIHTIPFPAVTICPESKISRQCVNYSKVLRMRKKGKGDLVPPLENDYFNAMAMLCKASNHNETESTRSLKDYAEFLNNCRSVEISDTLCGFLGHFQSCKKIMQPLITDEGLCYSFNMLDVRDIYSEINEMKYLAKERLIADWNIDDGYPDDDIIQHNYPQRILGSGAENSFLAVFLTKKSDISYSCTDLTFQGIRVSLHSPARIARPSQVFFPVGLDEMVIAQVTPTVMRTTSQVKEYNAEQRNCFFGRERKLKFFKVYTQSNCNLECWTNFTIQECGCVHFYMPRDSNTSICSLDKRQCLHKAAVRYGVSNYKFHTHTKLDSDCDCVPVCSDINYNAETSKAKWDWNDPSSTNAAKLKKYVKDYHASAVKVYFKGSYFLATEKSELYGMEDFISNVGGILGLFTGFSLFSLVELLYHLSVKIYENQRKYGYWAGPRNPAED